MSRSIDIAILRERLGGGCITSGGSAQNCDSKIRNSVECGLPIDFGALPQSVARIERAAGLLPARRPTARNPMCL
jgi:hypothetical protein